MSASQAAQRAIALAAAAFLAGCEDGQSPFARSTSPETVEVTAGANPATSARLVERDVEAPEVFQVTDDGLWDGRPSLGGVWVAYSDVKDPERVIIRNEATGKFVIGALFRRERENPGPRLQVSSDAASALGMLAGAPATLNVTALKREEAEPEMPISEEAPAIAAAEPIAEEPIAADGAAPVVLPPEGTEVASAEPGAGVEPQAPPKKERRGLFGFGRKKQTEPEPAQETAAADPAAPEAEGAAIAAEATAALAPPAAGSAPAAEVAAPAPAPVETAALEPGAGVEPQAPAKKERRGLFGFGRKKQDEPVGDPLTALAPVEVAGALPAAPEPKGRTKAPAAAVAKKAPGEKNFVQIGIFSVEGNAENTATAMRHDGMVPTIKESSANGKKYWRVLVGPATTAGDRSAILRKVKALGFTDAYLVTG